MRDKYQQARFEQYSEQMGYGDFEEIERDEDGCAHYRNPNTQGRWNFWVASRDALALQPSASAAPTVEQAIEALKIALRDSKGWMMDYSDSVIRDAIDRTAKPVIGAREEPCVPKFGARHTRCSLGTPGCVVIHEAEEPVSVYLVSTGEVYEGQETYTRHDSRPPLCDAERLYASPPGEPVDVATLAEAAYDAAIKYANGHEVDWKEVIESAIRGIGK